MPLNKETKQNEKKVEQMLNFSAKNSKKSVRVLDKIFFQNFVVQI